MLISQRGRTYQSFIHFAFLRQKVKVGNYSNEDIHLSMPPRVSYPQAWEGFVGKTKTELW